MKKRTVALAFLVLVAALVGGTIAVLRTRWAADRICALAAARVERATGLELAVAACRIRPLALELEAEGVRLGTAEAPIFTADALARGSRPSRRSGASCSSPSCASSGRGSRVRAAPGRGRDAAAGRVSAADPVAVRGPRPRRGGRRARRRAPRRPSRRDRAARRPLPPARAHAPRARRRPSGARASRSPRGRCGSTGQAGRSPRPPPSADVEVALDLSSATLHGAEVEVAGVRLGARGEVERPLRPFPGPRRDGERPHRRRARARGRQRRTPRGARRSSRRSAGRCARPS